MKAPERIWAGPAVGSKGAPTWDFNGMCPGDCDNDPSGLQYAEHAALYHHAATVTALQAEVDRLREALERLSTAGCMGDGRALGIHLPTHPVGQEIWARMQYAKAALSGDNQ